MIQFNKKHLIASILTLALLGAGYAAFQSLLISPLVQKQETQEKNIESLEEELSSANVSGAPSAVLNQYSLAELQMEVPNNRFEEQFLLDLEKAETLSGSTVKSAAFADETFSDQTAEQAPEEDSSAEETAENEAADAGNETDEPAEGSEEEKAVEAQPASDEPSLPSGMEKISVTVSLESDDYSSVRRFLETLESLKRITQIESVALSNPETAIPEEAVEETLKYDVIVSAYYMPNLEELKDDLPPFPKTNPGSVIDPFESPSTENIGESAE
ncbi:hypothetical protein [Metabacillus sp. 84]|uniref:hypothetical protein n=1 Tax=unclassified Metabacillus TaxID=2675274 RepID=UPI003CF3E330